MKTIIGFLLTFTVHAAEVQKTFTVDGSFYHDNACISDRGLVNHASQSALEKAEVICQGADIDQVGETRVLEIRRGSCWALSVPVHAIVAMDFICNTNSPEEGERVCGNTERYCHIFQECMPEEFDCRW